jgi:hypothetical protein
MAGSWDRAMASSFYPSNQCAAHTWDKRGDIND